MEDKSALSLWEEVGLTRWMHFGVIALLLKGVQQYNARQSITSNGTVQSHMEKVADMSFNDAQTRGLVAF